MAGKMSKFATLMAVLAFVWCCSVTFAWAADDTSDSGVMVQGAADTAAETGLAAVQPMADEGDGGSGIAIPDNPQVIQLDEEVSVTIGEDDVASFAFTPTKSGNYYFTSMGDEDTKGIVFTADEKIGENDSFDDEGLDENFRVYFAAEAGITYYLQASVFPYEEGESCTFTVKVEEGAKPIGYAPIPDNPQTIRAGQEKTVEITQAGEVVTFAFTPTTTGKYYAYSYGDESDTYDCVFTEDALVCAYKPHDNEYFYGEAGVTYYIQAKMESSSDLGSLTVGVGAAHEGGSPSTVRVADVDVLIWDSNYENCHVNPDLPNGVEYDIQSNTLKLSDYAFSMEPVEGETVTYADGTVGTIMGSSTFIYSDASLNVELSGNNVITWPEGLASCSGVLTEGDLCITGNGSLTLDFSKVEGAVTGIRAKNAIDIDGSEINVIGSDAPRALSFYGMTLQAWQNYYLYNNAKDLFYISINNAVVNISNSAVNGTINEYSGEVIDYMNMGIDSQDADLQISNSTVAIQMTGGITWGLGTGLTQYGDHYGGKLSVDAASSVTVILKGTCEKYKNLGYTWSLYYYDDAIDSPYIYAGDSEEAAGLVDKSALQKSVGNIDGRKECTDTYLELSPVKKQSKAQISVGSATVEAGKQVTLPVSIADNPGIAGLAFEVTLPEGATLNSIVKADVLADGTFTVNERTVSWFTGSNTSANGALMNVTLTAPSTAGTYKVGVALKGGKESNLSDENGDAVGAVFEEGTLTVTEPMPQIIDLSQCDIALEQDSFTYDGSPKTPSVTVKDGVTTLVEGTDYEVSYADNVQVGTATVTVTGKGGYTGSQSLTFTIVEVPKVDLSTCTITLSQDSFEYDGTAKTPSVEVKYEGTLLVEGTDYTVSYKNNTEAGTASVVISGKGSYTGSKEATFQIVEPQVEPRNISECDARLATTTYAYDGTAKTPAVIVTYDNVILVEGTDYTVVYEGNIEPGTGVVTIAGVGDYTGSTTLYFEIVERTDPGDDDDFEIEDGRLVRYWGEGPNIIIPEGVTSIGSGAFNFDDGMEVTVTLSEGVTEIEDNAFIGASGLTSINFPSSLTSIGSYAFYGCTSLSSVTFLGKAPAFGDLCFGDVTAKVYYPVSDTTWTDEVCQDYGGTLTWVPQGYQPFEKLEQGVVVFNDTPIKKTVGDFPFVLLALSSGNTDLTFKSSNQSVVKVSQYGKVTIVGVGKATITITAAESYLYKSASETVTITVRPKGTTISKLTNVKGKKMKVQWKKRAGITGYIIQYSTDKSFKKAVKTVTIKKASTVKKTIKKLKKKKKYFVRICTYKTVGGKNYNSAWSGAKAVKIKK